MEVFEDSQETFFKKFLVRVQGGALREGMLLLIFSCQTNDTFDAGQDSKRSIFCAKNRGGNSKKVSLFSVLGYKNDAANYAYKRNYKQR